MSIAAHLYGKAGRSAMLLLAVAVVVGGAGAQRRVNRGPRAVALLELYPGQGARLRPVVIWVEGRFYDAAIYQATPRPFALEPGNVYEAERTGNSAGFFTVEKARRAGRQWVAEGRWEPRIAGSKETAAPAGEDEPPVLRRPKEGEGSQIKSVAPEPPPEDPERPVLRRGKPASRNVPEPEEEPRKPSEVLVAVSDAGGPDPRSFDFPFAPGEQEQLLAAMREEARRVLLPRIVPSGGARTSPPPIEFEDVRFRAFDLNTDNNPELVFSARTRPLRLTRNAGKSTAPQVLHVLVVARNLYDGLRTLHSWSGAAAQVAASGRLELVDAVDADGNQAGDLLFRRIGGEDDGSFVLFRAGVDRLWELFDTAGH